MEWRWFSTVNLWGIVKYCHMVKSRPNLQLAFVWKCRCSEENSHSSILKNFPLISSIIFILWLLTKSGTMYGNHTVNTSIANNHNWSQNVHRYLTDSQGREFQSHYSWTEILLDVIHLLSFLHSLILNNNMKNSWSSQSHQNLLMC